MGRCDSMREVADGWGEAAVALEGLLGSNVGWRFWSPEVIRAINGSKSAIPPLPNRSASHASRIEAWGPLLPLFHFHLGWPRVDVGLARWAAAGFDPLSDPTLAFIHGQWGRGLSTFVLWSAQGSGAPDPAPLPSDLLAGLRRDAASRDVASPEELHLENHWSLEVGGHWSGPYDCAMDDPIEDFFERRDVGPGEVELIVPVYRGWYRILTHFGDSLPQLESGRSWKIHLTIAPIGYVGEFRRSRISGRWFTGRHRAHELGISLGQRR